MSNISNIYKQKGCVEKTRGLDELKASIAAHQQKILEIEENYAETVEINIRRRFSGAGYSIERVIADIEKGTFTVYIQTRETGGICLDSWDGSVGIWEYEQSAARKIELKDLVVAFDAANRLGWFNDMDLASIMGNGFHADGSGDNGAGDDDETDADRAVNKTVPDSIKQDC